MQALQRTIQTVLDQLKGLSPTDERLRDEFAKAERLPLLDR
jgi:hypothetical protein